MDMPAGIMREAGGVEIPICEIQAHAVPASPSDVALDLGVINSEIVPGMNVESEVDARSSHPEQINTGVGPPGGQHVLDMPAGIMREAVESSRAVCEILAHAVPEWPSDVPSDLRFNNGESVPGKEVDSEVDAAHSSQLDGPIGCAELFGSCWVADVSSGIQVAVDAWIEEGCPCDASMGSQAVDQDGDAQQTWRENVVIELGRDLDGKFVATGVEGRVSRRSVGGSPESVVAVKKPVPVNFISAASCYVEGPSREEMLRDANRPQKRTSFCRIEAFVIRSRSRRAVPVRDYGSKQTSSNS